MCPLRVSSYPGDRSGGCFEAELVHRAVQVEPASLFAERGVPALPRDCQVIPGDRAILSTTFRKSTTTFFVASALALSV